MTTQILAGVLQLELPIATGEHSIIYQCTDLRTGCTYICKKVCYSKFNQNEEEALNYEISIAHKVNHRNLVAYLDIIHDKTCQMYYIIMPFYRFSNLGAQICGKIENRGRFEEAYIWLVLVQCLLALDYFTSQLSDVDTTKDITDGVMLGDIRPTSIYTDLQGNAYIATFRLSKHISLLNSDAALKLLPYWAPERLMNRLYNSKADIWTLGCTIYEMCLLHSLFKGNRDDILEQMQMLKRPIKIPHYSEDLQEIVNILLEPSPDKRPSAVELLKHPAILEYKHFYDEQVNSRKLALGYQIPQKGLCKICGGNGLDCCEIVRLAVVNSKRLSYVDENGNLVYVDTLAEQKAGIARVANKQTMEHIYSLINPDSRKANYFNIQSTSKDLIRAKQQAAYAWGTDQSINKVETEDTRSIIMNSIKDRYCYNEQNNYFPKDRYREPGTYQPSNKIPMTLIQSAKHRHTSEQQIAHKEYNRLEQWSYEGSNTINFQTQYSDKPSWAYSNNTDVREAPSIVSNAEENGTKSNRSPSYKLGPGSGLSSTTSQSSFIDELLFQVRSASPPKPICKDFVPLTSANSPTPPPQYKSITNVPVTKVTTEYEAYPPSTHTLMTPSTDNVSCANVSVQSVAPANDAGSNIHRSRPHSKLISGQEPKLSTLVSSTIPSRVPSTYNNDSFLTPINSIYKDSAYYVPSIHPASEYDNT